MSLSTDLQIWIGALLTLMVFSFLWRDNPFYKFAEHVFVGVSAAYWMVIGFWTTLWPRVLVPLWPDLVRVVEPTAEPPARDLEALLPTILGLTMLMRLHPRLAHVARWPTAFILGTTAGYAVVRYVRSDFLYQIRAAIGEGLFVRAADGGWDVANTVSVWIILAGTVCGLIYFMNTRSDRGALIGPARAGRLILMVTFGASFGSAVMARISLLIGRLQMLLGDWLGLL
jgi:hypothetical protein